MPAGDQSRAVHDVCEDLADGVKVVVRFEEGAVGRWRGPAVDIVQDGLQVRLHERDQLLQVSGVGTRNAGLAVDDEVVAALCVILYIIPPEALAEGSAHVW